MLEKRQKKINIKEIAAQENKGFIKYMLKCIFH